MCLRQEGLRSKVGVDRYADSGAGLTFTLAYERESHGQVGARGVTEQFALADLAAGLDEMG